jgi:hypothetical protein
VNAFAQTMTCSDERRKLALSERSLIVWRMVAATGRTGITLSHLADRLQGVLDYLPVKVLVRSLRDSGYVTFKGESRWGVNVITGRIPHGEKRPAWLDDEPDDPPPAAVVTPPARPMSVFNQGADLAGIQPTVVTTPAPAPAPAQAEAPASVVAAAQDFAVPASVTLEVESVADAVARLSTKPPAKRRSTPAAAFDRPTVRFTPLFSLNSAGSLRLDLMGTDSVALDPDTTRALFTWLDQISGSQLARLAQPAAQP